jgi:diguanylate cyclase (GGDEF)-like protein
MMGTADLPIPLRRLSPRALRGGTICFGLVGVVACVLHLVADSEVVGLLTYAVVGVGACLALLAVPTLHRPRPLAPWLLFSAACLFFLAGAVIRMATAGPTGMASGMAHLFTVPGYLLSTAAFLLLLRARRTVDRHAMLDCLTICLGVALLVFVLLAQPAMLLAGRATWATALAGVYPFFDLVLLLVLLNLAFTTAGKTVSYWFLMGTVTMMLVGDVGYLRLATSGHESGSPQHDLPFLIAYTFAGIGALHPSIASFSGTEPEQTIQAWSWRRLALLAPALVVPFALVAVGPMAMSNAATRLAIAIAGAGMVAALLARATNAVHAYARGELVFRHQARHDALTGLANRRLLVEQVTRMLTAQAESTGRDEQAWLLFMDLDGFKLVNDSWGHDVGDELLVDVAGRLHGSLTTSRAIISRIGGDEFVVAAPGGPEEGMRLATHILEAFAAPFRLSEAELVVSPSIGIAGSRSSTSAEALIRDADTAMYRAKAEGRNRWVVFDNSMRERVRDRVEIELALRYAIERGQLLVEYQPIVDMVTQRPLGAEALLRWHHPVLGDVSPDRFVPIAEDSGMIVEIGEWVLATSLTQLTDWRAEGRVDDDFFVSVNVSTRQLRDARLVSTVGAALTRTGTPARTLVLEITESSMLEHSDTAADVLLALRALGVRLSVDDFGTGYSALGYLRRFPITGVKIDREFIAGLGHSAEDEEIVRAVTAMGHALRLIVVAEGVETLEQQDHLRRLGVDQAQGWLYGRSMTALPPCVPADHLEDQPADLSELLPPEPVVLAV